MAGHLVVSTECPLCGAPLDFAEGSNAVRCQHCRSNLLVTGRKQVLSYYVAPKLDHEGATAKVATAKKQGGTRYTVVSKQLYFIPYYRLTGHDFRWEVPPEKPVRAAAIHPLMTPMSSTSDWSSETQSIDLFSLFESAGQLLGKVFGSSKETRRTMDNDHRPSVTHTKTVRSGLYSSLVNSSTQNSTIMPRGLSKIRLFNQYVEKNFIACKLDGVGLYSLGVRPSVLRLELYRKEVLDPLGKIVQANIQPREALLHGMKAGRKDAISYRKVLGRMLSVIYFPFWVVQLKVGNKDRLAVVDAVSQSVITLAAPLSLYETLNQEVSGEPPVIGFRPLTCPNCGWDLPIRPDNVIFYCSSCEKSWQIMGDCLYEVSYCIARLNGENPEGELKYLPFWVLETRSEENGCGRLFLPAFRYRQLKFLSDVAMRVTRKQPEYTVLTEKLPEVQGCFYDQEDAVMLAQFSQVGMAPCPLEQIKAIQGEKSSFSNATLTWFPYKINGNHLIDPFTGHRLMRNLLI
ncbi:MAG: hypothetical protein GTO40_20665 [Deltaproteobacteria bacterium]|nr:hypothetical protein [Deltaproteobacteria bacterium]